MYWLSGNDTNVIVFLILLLTAFCSLFSLLVVLLSL